MLLNKRCALTIKPCKSTIVTRILGTKSVIEVTKNEICKLFARPSELSTGKECNNILKTLKEHFSALWAFLEEFDTLKCIREYLQEIY